MCRSIKRLFLIGFSMCVFTSLFAAETPVTLRVYLAGGTFEQQTAKDVIKQYTDKHPDIIVETIKAPDSSEMLTTYLQLIEAKSSDLDLVTLDSSWAINLASSLIDLTKYREIDKQTIDQYYPSIITSYRIDNKIVALPWYSDVGLLYYRTDLLEKYNQTVPKTWQELTKSAYIIQEGERKTGNNDFVGFVWQGKCYEGLTCNAIEWIHNNNGGTIVDDNKQITINNPKAIEAVTLASRWVGTISPKGVLDMTEDESKNVFMSGNAAFVRSWPYLYTICNVNESPIKGKFSATNVPAGVNGENSGVLGGWGIGVNKYSKNVDEAVKLVKFITSVDAQKYRALKSGNAPNIVSLKNDKDLMKFEIFKIVNMALPTGFNRPFIQTYPNYNKVSQAFYKTVYKILKKETTPYAGLEELAKEIQHITDFKIK